MHAISYNLVRALMQQAAIDHQVDLTRISFKGTADTLRHWSASLEVLRGKPRKQQALLDAMCLNSSPTILYHCARGERNPGR